MPRLDQGGLCAPRKQPMLEAASHTATGSSVSTIALRFLQGHMGRLPALLMVSIKWHTKNTPQKQPFWHMYLVVPCAHGI